MYLASVQKFVKENIIVQLFIWSYAVFIFTSWLVLQLPPCKKIAISNIDTLFIAASAISTTGLATVDIETTFSFIGQLAILLMIQLGGIAHLVFASFLILNFEEKKNSFQLKISPHPLSLSRGFTIRELLKQVITYTVLCEVIGGIMLYLFFKMDGVEDSFWHAVFHSVSAFCTAGFSPFPSNLEEYVGHFGINITISFFSILGAFGFFLWSDLFKRMLGRGKSPKVLRRIFQSFVTTVILFGTVLFLFKTKQIMPAFFQAVSAITTVGFNTIEMRSALPSTLILLIFFMLLGASLTLTATCKSLSIMAIKRISLSFFSQKKTVRVRGQRAFLKRVQIAFSPLNKYLIVLSIVVLFLKITEKQPFLFLLFEGASALCTVGFNTGVTAELSFFGKGFIIFLMLTGRAGILLFSYAVFAKKFLLEPKPGLREV